MPNLPLGTPTASNGVCIPTAHQKSERPGLELTEQESENKDFEGLWRSPNGSLYVFDVDCFICVSVHSSLFIAWLNKIAVKDIHKAGDHWLGLQAFRDLNTGTDTQWAEITLEVLSDKVIKHFPTYLPRTILVNGYIEVYDRVMSD